MKANASKHKAMSYGRMDEKEKELEHEVEELLRRAESVDAEEDQRYGKGIRGDELPEELQPGKRDWRRSDKPRKPLKSGSPRKPNLHRKKSIQSRKTRSTSPTPRAGL